MHWWGWLIIGIVLLGAEIFAIDAQFYLIFIGAGAIAVGLTLFLGVELPVWAQWIAFAALSLAFMVALRRKLYEQLRGPKTPLGSAAVGKTVLIPQDLAPGSSCRAEFRGTTWKAVNIGNEAIPAQSDAVIDAVDGLTLHVRPNV